jgi:hypothetical protein
VRRLGDELDTRNDLLRQDLEDLEAGEGFGARETQMSSNRIIRA